jgi:hypothetical protein
VVVAVPALGVLERDSTGTVAISPGPATTSPALGPAAENLQDLIDPDSVVVIPRELPGGWILQAQTVGADGTVVGVGVREEDGAWTDQMWMFRPHDAAPQAVDGPRIEEFALSPAVSEQGLFWVERRDEPYDLFVMCTDVREPGEVQVLGDSGMMRGYVPVLVDVEVAIWTDQGRDPFGNDNGAQTVPTTVWMVRGCGGEPSAVASDSYAVAFSYPDVFVRPVGADEGAPVLHQVDVETAQVTGEVSLPLTLGAHKEESPARFAANSTIIAWIDGDLLTIFDRQSETLEQVTGNLPVKRGANGSQTLLTAGSHLVAYSSIPIPSGGGDPSGSAQSIVYDLRTGERRELSGIVYAAGDWLLWHGEGEGNSSVYHLGQVRD